MEILPTILVLSLIVNVLLWHMLGQTKASAISKAKTRLRSLANLALPKRDSRTATILNDIADNLDGAGDSALGVVQYFKEEECSQES